MFEITASSLSEKLKNAAHVANLLTIKDEDGNEWEINSISSHNPAKCGVPVTEITIKKKKVWNPLKEPLVPYPYPVSRQRGWDE